MWCNTLLHKYVKNIQRDETMQQSLRPPIQEMGSQITSFPLKSIQFDLPQHLQLRVKACFQTQNIFGFLAARPVSLNTRGAWQTPSARQPFECLINLNGETINGRVLSLYHNSASEAVKQDYLSPSTKCTLGKKRFDVSSQTIYDSLASFGENVALAQRRLTIIRQSVRLMESAGNREAENAWGRKRERNLKTDRQIGRQTNVINTNMDYSSPSAPLVIIRMWRFQIIQVFFLKLTQTWFTEAWPAYKRLKRVKIYLYAITHFSYKE